MTFILLNNDVLYYSLIEKKNGIGKLYVFVYGKKIE